MIHTLLLAIMATLVVIATMIALLCVFVVRTILGAKRGPR